MAQDRHQFRLRYQRVKLGTFDFGLVNEVKITAKGVELGRDSYGRTVVGGFDVKGEFNVMASDNATARALVDIVKDSGSQTLLFEGVGGDIGIPSVLLNLELEVAMDGKPSKLKAIFDRYMTADELYAAFLATETTGTPPVVDPYV